MSSGLSSIVTNPYLILLLICHLLSDYYFQSQKMADRKDQDKKYPLYCFHNFTPFFLFLSIIAFHQLSDVFSSNVLPSL